MVRHGPGAGEIGRDPSRRNRSEEQGENIISQQIFDPAAVARLTRDDFAAAARRIAGDIIRTPLLPYHGDRNGRILLKAENLQPLGSFKIRCAANAASLIGTDGCSRIATASAGNFAQGLALAAQRRGIALTVHVPATAARVKIASLATFGAKVVERSFDDWWRNMTTRETGAEDGIFIHPVSEEAVIAGNGTIGLELVEQVPELETIVVPYGGGGLASGIALALRACGSKAKIVAVEIETSRPLSSALDAAQPVTVSRTPSFVDGIGSTRVLDEMWPLVRRLIDDVIVVTLDETRDALRSAYADNHIVLEGAGATALAAARRIASRPTCAILSGGNIDFNTFTTEIARAETTRIHSSADQAIGRQN